MRATAAALALALLPALWLGAVLLRGTRAGIASPSGAGGAYTVAEAQVLLARRAAASVGETVSVRGLVRGCAYRLPGPCASWQPELRDPSSGSGATGTGLLLVPVPAHPAAITVLLRRIPVLRELVTGPQEIRWGTVATYRVRLQALTCPHRACREVLLPDSDLIVP